MSNFGRNRFPPPQIPLISLPVTGSNRWNAKQRPVKELGSCTPSQLFDRISMSREGTVCILGDSGRGISLADAMSRRSRKPFLFLGTAADAASAFSALKPGWTQDAPTQYLPAGNGALYLSDPSGVYSELCSFLPAWSRDRFLILHTGTGLQLGAEMLNRLSGAGQCLILCDRLPQSLRSSESRTITPQEFIQQLDYLFVFSAGAASKDLVDLFPTARYQRVTNSMNLNSYGGPGRRRLGLSLGQSRTEEDRKSAFERDELQKLASSGTLVVYSVVSDSLYLADLT